jgi:hypothetical protein
MTGQRPLSAQSRPRHNLGRCELLQSSKQCSGLGQWLLVHILEAELMSLRGMSTLAEHYADLSEAELEAARSAPSRFERRDHLESAFRFAQLAVQETQRRGNVIGFGRSANGVGCTQHP